MNRFFIFVVLLTSVNLAHAQQLSVGGVKKQAYQSETSIRTLSAFIQALSKQLDTMQVQMTNIQNSITSLSGRLTTIESQIARQTTCNNRGRVYAPSRTGADADGCAEVSFTNP